MANIETFRGGFRVRYRVQLADGTWKRKASERFDYEYQAQAWMDRGAAQVDAIAATSPAPIRNPLANAAPTLAAYALTFNRRHQMGESLRGQYARAATYLGTLDWAQQPMDELTREHIELWMADMVEDGTPGPPTQRQRVKYVRSLYLDAIALRRVPFDATAGVTLPRLDLRPARVLEADERARLLAACDTQTRAMVLCALEAGLRWAEVAGLRGDAVNLTAGYLKVHQVVDRRSGLLRKSTKSHHSRSVPVTPVLAEALRPLLRFRPGLLFTSDQGRQLGYDNWRHRAWYPARTKAKLDDPAPRFHDLRHTYGTTLGNAGVPLATIAILMGHADTKTTAIYVHNMASDPLMQQVLAALA